MAYIPAHPLGQGKRKFWRFYEHELSAWLSAQFNDADKGVTLSSRPAHVGPPESIESNIPSRSFHAERSAFVNGRSPRYQRGSLTVLRHRNAPDTWVFRYYANENGKRVYKRKTIGTLVNLPRRKDAEKAVAQLRMEINEVAGVRPVTVEQLAVHYRSVELPVKAYSTRRGYEIILNACVLPRWGQSNLLSLESMEVERWIHDLKTKSGDPASPATKSKVRNLMSALFSHAIRYGWTARNPITPVRTSSKRKREPAFLTPSEFQSLLRELPEREHLMVLLAGSTGLRRGELIGLRWSDIDFEQQLLRVTRSIWHNIAGETKTLASCKPVPLQPAVIEELRCWRTNSLYRGPEDFLFPSLRANGKHPVDPNMILRIHVQPALARLGIIKAIGWHSFRHGFSNLLRKNGVDLKTAQELLRHANSRITLEIYQQSLTEERRKAQAVAFAELVGVGGHYDDQT